jgi:vacuolar iron transporter family protein
LEEVKMSLSEKVYKALLEFQRNEITEHFVYNKLSEVIKNENNKSALKKIAGEELIHYKIWQGYTQEEVKPVKWKGFWYYMIARLLGITFAMKLMEKTESDANTAYTSIKDEIPEAERIAEDENRHEQMILSLLEEEHLKYVSSVVLGLNDALVELTGALAGFTFALGQTKLIALTGLITGIAASLSMASSEYLSSKAETGHEEALKSSLYTGAAYLITVSILILPFLLIANNLIALALTVAAAIIIIFVFNFYISVAKDLDFKHRFLEMAAISLGVSLLSFGIGYLVKIMFGIDI